MSEPLTTERGELHFTHAHATGSSGFVIGAPISLPADAGP